MAPKYFKLNGGQGEHGVYLDREAVDAGIAILSRQCADSERALPWAGREKPTSSKALAIECQKNNLPTPPSTSEDDPACEEWETRYGESFPWIRHIRNWRKSNRMLRLLETMRDRCRPDSTLIADLSQIEPRVLERADSGEDRRHEAARGSTRRSAKP